MNGLLDVSLLTLLKEEDYVFTSFCLSVCLSKRLLEKLWKDIDEIFSMVGMTQVTVG